MIQGRSAHTTGMKGRHFHASTVRSWSSYETQRIFTMARDTTRYSAPLSRRASRLSVRRGIVNSPLVGVKSSSGSAYAMGRIIKIAGTPTLKRKLGSGRREESRAISAMVGPKVATKIGNRPNKMQALVMSIWSSWTMLPRMQLMWASQAGRSWFSR